MTDVERMILEQLSMISGRGNPDISGFEQIIDTSANTKKFYGFIPINGDAVIATLTNKNGTNGLTPLGAGGIAYQNIFYPGDFKAITLTSGKVIIYLKKQ